MRQQQHRTLKPTTSRHAKAFANVFTKEHEVLHAQKNAAPWHGIAGWPIVGWRGPVAAPVANAVSIAQALSLLANGQPDILNFAVNPAQLSGAGTYNPSQWLNGYPVGQAPWNNWLNTSIRPFNNVKPSAMGIHWGTWGAAGDATGLITMLIEHTEIQLLEAQNTKFYQPAFSMPPGVRFDRRGSSTQPNSYQVTEGFGDLSAHDLFELVDTIVFSPEKDYHLVLNADQSLKSYLATLTGPNATTGETTGQLSATNIIPTQGTMILMLGFGSQLQPLGSQI